MNKLLLAISFFVVANLLRPQVDIIKLKEKISTNADKIETKCIKWRRDIHELPELGNQEFKTAKLIADQLKKPGIEVKEGVMGNPKVDVIFGLHIESAIEVGKIEYKPGAFIASSDWFTIKVKGKGSHGSQHRLGIDLIHVSAQIIEGLQNIISRQSELTKAPVIFTVGKRKEGVRNNSVHPNFILMKAV